MKCPNCGEMNEPGARFCFNCGTRLEETAGEQAAAETPIPERPVAPTAPVGRVPSATEPIDSQGASGTTERPAQPQYVSSPTSAPAAPQYPDWQGADYGRALPPTERKGRNRLLMIVLGILLGCLILCVGIFIYSLTPSGQNFFEDVGTSVADMATEAADN